MHFFGQHWEAHEYRDFERVPTPVGEACAWCEEPIEAKDFGYVVPGFYRSGVREKPWHQECFLRQVVGSLGHQERRCTCYGGEENDPVGFSRRQAARMAVAKFHAEHGETT
jgi:hypothetical protein